MVLECLYKSKLQDSVQLQTVTALYDQEAVRNIRQPSHSRLKTSVRLHIDQTLRTRNFRVRKNGGERGSHQELRKEIFTLTGMWDIAISGKQMASVRRETHVVSAMIRRLETDARRGRKADRPLPHQIRRHRLTDKNPQTGPAVEGQAPLEHEVTFRAKIPFGESAQTRHVIIGTLTCVEITGLKHDAGLATNAIFDM